MRKAVLVVLSLLVLVPLPAKATRAARLQPIGKRREAATRKAGAYVAKRGGVVARDVLLSVEQRLI